MKRFHFALQPLLELREYHEQEWETELGRITGICNSLEAKIRKCRDDARKAVAARGHDLEYLRFTEHFTARMNQQVIQLQKELAERQKEREEILEKYLEVSRERQVVDHLKDRRKEEYYKEAGKIEERALDEIGSGAAARRLQEEQF